MPRSNPPLCPHCGEAGVEQRARANSTAVAPAQCTNCGGLSYAATPWFDHALVYLSYPIGVVWFILTLWVAGYGIAALMAILVGPVLVMIGLSTLLRSRTHLKPTDAAKVRRARISGYIFLAGVALVIVLGIIYSE